VTESQELYTVSGKKSQHSGHNFIRLRHSFVIFLFNSFDHTSASWKLENFAKHCNSAIRGDDGVFDVIKHAVFRRRQTFAKGKKHHTAGQLLK